MQTMALPNRLAQPLSASKTTIFFKKYMTSCKLIIVFFLSILMTAACVTNKKRNGGSNALSVSNGLYDTIAHLDSTLFEAFNRRDLSALKGFFSEELEFYHDLGGVTNYNQNMDAFERTFLSERKLRRELVKSSLEVYPIKDFGAVETGVHLFYVTEKGQKEKLSSEAKFIHLWQKRNGEWKITRIISYAHRENIE